MSANALTKVRESFPTIFNDFFRPWNEWFDNGGLPERTLTVPAVNISEEANGYKVTLAAPGMKKEDFKVGIDGDIMSISAETETEKEEKDKKFTRKEYNYSSFSRSFTLPEGIIREQIEARYDNGLLTLVLPRKEDAKVKNSKNITVN